MKFARSAVLSCLFSAPVIAFNPIASRNDVVGRGQSSTSSPCTTFMSDSSDDGNDGDDWFAELDSRPQENSYGNNSRWDSSSEYGSSGSFGRTSYGRGGGRGRGGGGGSFGYAYERDTSRDESNVDVAAVEALLNERSQYKKQRNFDAADEIRDALLSEYAVGVNDRERTWRTGCSPGGSGLSGGYGRPQRRQGRGGGGRRGTVDFGPFGHDYNLSPDAGENTSSYAEDEIHKLLAERLQAKLAKNFRNADDIQAELISKGVYVHDGQKQWRADGVPFETLNRNGEGDQGGRRMRGRRAAYVKSNHSDAFDGDEGEIIEALQERERSRAQKDFQSADKIRDYLMNELNIFIDDRLREWSVGGDFGDEINQQRAMSKSVGSRNYVKASTSEELIDPDNEPYIQLKVDERQQAKYDRDYGLADDIRDELLEAYNVVIHDKIRQWSVGGDFGDASLSKGAGVYRRRGGGNLSEEEVGAISSLITERHQAKQDRRYEVADEIRANLLEKYGVTIDDFCNEWRVASEDYGQASSPPNARVLSDKEVAFVQEQLKKRAAYKKKKDYDSADDIRDALRESFGVNIDDRTKEWTVVEIAAVGNDDGADNDIDAALADIFDVGEDDGNDDADASSIMEQEQEEEQEEITAERNGAVSAEDLTKLTVPVLKGMLKERGLKVSGKKAELVDRLLA